MLRVTYNYIVRFFFSELLVDKSEIPQIQIKCIVGGKCSAFSDLIYKRSETGGVRQSGHSVGLGCFKDKHILQIMYAVVLVVEAVVYSCRHFRAAVIAAAGAVYMP